MTLAKSAPPAQVAAPDPPPAPVGAGKARGRRRQTAAAHVFLAPWLIGLVVITALPMLASLVLSFTDYNILSTPRFVGLRSEEHTSELQSRENLVCRLLLEKKK